MLRAEQYRIIYAKHIGCIGGIALKIGLCLTGGGAKGAFEAGIIKRLHENGICPEIVTGTSIGAINGYFMMKGCYKELISFWSDIDGKNLDVKIGRTIDNSPVINYLSELEGDNLNVRNMYINYVMVENSKLVEEIHDIKYMDKEGALNCVRYSALLPARPVEGSGEEAIKKFDSSKLFENFKEDVMAGIYHGYKLDGGILNNNLLAPFIKNPVDKLIIIGLKDDYSVPKYIYDYYDKEKVIVIIPDVKIMPEDTIRFEKEYCSSMLERGYRLSEKLVGQLRH